MTARRAEVLTLMQRKARCDMGRMGAALGTLRSREMQEFDLLDRLARMLDISARPEAGPMTPGQLASAHYMGRTLTEQMSLTEAQMSRTRQERAALEHDLAQQQRRARVLADHAAELRRDLAGACDAAAEQAAQRRRG